MMSSRSKRGRASASLKAYVESLHGATKRIADPFLEKVGYAISIARRVHPRDNSEEEKRLGIAFNRFQDTIFRAATELRSILRRRLDRPAMLRLGRSIGRLVDEEVGRARAESTAPPSACRRGCHFCCYLPVETTVPQVLVIADQLSRTRSPSELQDLRNRMDEYEAKAARHPSGKGLALCPLNVDGACSAYDVRPTICRSYNSTDAGACERSLAKDWGSPIPIDYAPIGAEVAVQAGYQLAGSAHGHQYTPVPLVPALHKALDHHDLYRIEDFEDPIFDLDKPVVSPSRAA
jgi:hypothetical protein